MDHTRRGGLTAGVGRLGPHRVGDSSLPICNQTTRVSTDLGEAVAVFDKRYPADHPETPYDMTVRCMVAGPTICPVPSFNNEKQMAALR